MVMMIIHIYILNHSSLHMFLLLSVREAYMRIHVIIYIYRSTCSFEMCQMFGVSSEDNEKIENNLALLRKLSSHL